jgi:hypothetical protein
VSTDQEKLIYLERLGEELTRQVTAASYPGRAGRAGGSADIAGCQRSLVALLR